MLDHLGHAKGFAGTGDAEQHLMLLTFIQSPYERFDGGRLVAPRLIVDTEAKRHSLFSIEGGMSTFDLFALRFRFTARESIHFPAGTSGNLLRGGFGRIFKGLACTPECSDSRQCPI